VSPAGRVSCRSCLLPVMPPAGHAGLAGIVRIHTDNPARRQLFGNFRGVSRHNWRLGGVHGSEIVLRNQGAPRHKCRIARNKCRIARNKCRIAEDQPVELSVSTATPAHPAAHSTDVNVPMMKRSAAASAGDFSSG
jgi:hypothetical protein